MSGPVKIRAIAAEVVGRVMRQGAYSNILADEATSALSPRDRARAKALIYGVLRRLEDIDRVLETASGRPLGALDPAVLDRLRVSGFEVLYGDLPQPVTVSTGVDLVRSVNPRAAGLANAVLRSIASSERPDAGGLELPEWLVRVLKDEWGAEEVGQFSVASAQEPERVARSRESRQAGYAGVMGAVSIEPGPVPADMVVQDAASIAVGNAVAAEPGMRVLDLAAAPGGKTLHLLDQVGDEGTVIAVDHHARRVRAAARRVPEALWVQADGAHPPFAPATFDRVLLDAPCTGLGTLRRRPEIRLRVDQTMVAGMAETQRQLLAAALELVVPGGRLVYSVCTVTPEETVEVVAGLGMHPVEGPGRVWGDGLLMAPHLTGTDGMFISVHQA